MRYFKSFKKGMVCRGKQYQEHTEYEEDGGNVCSAGMMHFCETPFDTLDYYPLVNENCEFSDFAVIEALDDVKKEGNKCACKKIRIGAKLSFRDFIRAGVSVLIEKTSSENVRKDTDLNDNDEGYAQISSSGNWAKIGSSGGGAKIGSSGGGAKIGSSGGGAKIGSSGDLAKIGSSGNEAKIKMRGARSVGAAIGYKSSVMGKKGDWIVLAEWKRDDEDKWYPACIKAGQIDNVTLKEDTWYCLKNGEFKEDLLMASEVKER